MKGHVYQKGEKLTGKSWTYIIDLPPDTITGKRRQKSKGGFRLEKEAEAACAKEITKINKGLFVEGQNMMLRNLLR